MNSKRTWVVRIDVHVVLRIRDDMRVRIPRGESICSQPLEARDHTQHALHLIIICGEEAFKRARGVLDIRENKDAILHKAIIQWMVDGEPSRAAHVVRNSFTQE